MRRSGPLPLFQALMFHLIKPRFRDFRPSSQEGLRQKVERTSSTSTFQHFQNHSNPKALRYFLSLGNNIPAIYFMIKISEYESFQNFKEDTDLSTVEWFPKSRPIYIRGPERPWVTFQCTHTRSLNYGCHGSFNLDFLDTRDFHKSTRI